MLSAWRWFALALGVVIADQITKALVLARFSLGERLEVTGFFNMVLVYNKGAAIGIVGTFIVRSAGRTMLLTGLGLILGGALGNLIDRLRFGQVVDFLDFHAQGWHWPAFNVADSAITLGAVLLILEGFVHREGRASSSP